MHEEDDEAQCQRQLAKASEQAALAESEKEYDSTHEAEQRAGQMKQAYKDDYAAWHAVARVTEQLWAKLPSRTRPQKLQPKSKRARAPVFEWELIINSPQPRRAITSPRSSLPTYHACLKQMIELRGHSEELPDMQPETAEKQKKEIEALTRRLASCRRGQATRDHAG